MKRKACRYYSSPKGIESASPPQIPPQIPEAESEGRDESRAVHAPLRDVVPHGGQPQRLRRRLLRPLAARLAEGPYGLQGKRARNVAPPVRPTSHFYLSVSRKDFVVAMDIINAKTVGDKLRWAFLVFDPKRKGYIQAGLP